LTTIYDYARFYAQSEKALTDRLNEVVGKRNWMKTKRMIDVYAQGRSSIEDRREEIPQWLSTYAASYTDGSGNTYPSYGNTVYRGVIFNGHESVNAKLLINPVEAREEGDLVLVRSWHKVEINAAARYWSIGQQGLPWEDNEEAKSLWERARIEVEKEWAAD